MTHECVMIVTKVHISKVKFTVHPEQNCVQIMSPNTAKLDQDDVSHNCQMLMQGHFSKVKVTEHT